MRTLTICALLLLAVRSVGAQADTQPPTAPGSLTATPASNGQINLVWAASTDNVAVTGYLIERCQGAACATFAQVAAPAGTGTSYSDPGLLAATSYSYRVRATDAAGNLSSYSSVASAATPAVAVTFVQANSAVPQTPQTSVTVPFTSAQAAGDLNVVAVGWSDSTTEVQSVTDTKGNTYVRAVGPTVQSGVATASLYYAANITAAVAGGNTVTVTFNTLAPYPDVRIAEYGGVAAAAPVDVTAAAQGTATPSNSGVATTTNANDLLVGANLVQGLTSGAGASFTSRVITSPDGNILEDRLVTMVGSYSATAPVSSGAWIMQMVAFRSASGLSTHLHKRLRPCGAEGDASA